AAIRRVSSAECPAPGVVGASAAVFLAYDAVVLGAEPCAAGMDRGGAVLSPLERAGFLAARHSGDRAAAAVDAVRRPGHGAVHCLSRCEPPAAGPWPAPAIRGGRFRWPRARGTQ